jgi:hypothetical protein
VRLRVAVVHQLGLQVHGAADDQIGAALDGRPCGAFDGVAIELLRGQFGVFQPDAGMQCAEVLQYAAKDLHAVGSVQDQHVFAVGRAQCQAAAADLGGVSRRGRQQGKQQGDHRAGGADRGHGATHHGGRPSMS